MALGRQVVNFVGLDLLENPDQVGGVGEIPVMEDHFLFHVVGVAVQMVDAVRVEQGCAAFDAVDFVAFGKKEFGEVGSVLSGDAGDQCFFHGMSFLCRVVLGFILGSPG